MAKVENWLKYLDIISQRVRHHHDALWEEEKHYSWWIYPILAGTVWVLASEQLKSDPCLQTMIITGASLLGIYLSWAAFTTIRREYGFFREWRKLQEEVEGALRDQRKIGDRKTEGKALPFTSPIKETPGIGITKIFQVNFMVTLVFFALIIALNAYRLCSLLSSASPA